LANIKTCKDSRLFDSHFLRETITHLRPLPVVAPWKSSARPLSALVELGDGVARNKRALVGLMFWEVLTGAVTSMNTPMLARGVLPDIQRHARIIAGTPPVPTKGHLQEGARGPGLMGQALIPPAL
jgi:hypothetical protein